jgi:hypothetical protein
MSTITICTSVNFYKQAAEVEAQLERLGYKVLLPETAYRMKETGDYDADRHRTWLKNPDDYHKKTAFIKGHFPKIEQGDAILVLNYEKHGISNYIGGNVLIEMGVAFYLNKQIFVLNDIPKESSFYEELVGMNPIVLNGTLGDIKGHISVS